MDQSCGNHNRLIRPKCPNKSYPIDLNTPESDGVESMGLLEPGDEQSRESDEDRHVANMRVGAALVIPSAHFFLAQ